MTRLDRIQKNLEIIHRGSRGLQNPFMSILASDLAFLVTAARVCLVLADDDASYVNREAAKRLAQEALSELNKEVA